MALTGPNRVLAVCELQVNAFFLVISILPSAVPRWLQVLRKLPWVWRQLTGIAQIATFTAAQATSSTPLLLCDRMLACNVAWSFADIKYGEAFRAVDGQYANYFASETCVRTDMTTPARAGSFQEIRIDLGDEKDVKSMTIWPILDSDSLAAGRTKARRFPILLTAYKLVSLAEFFDFCGSIA
jgi:hypothetical protein